MTPQDIGHNLRQIRRYKDVTQRELAEMVGCDTSAVSKWEHGACGMKLENLVAVLDALGYEIKFVKKEAEE